MDNIVEQLGLFKDFLQDKNIQVISKKSKIPWSSLKKISLNNNIPIMKNFIKMLAYMYPRDSDLLIKNIKDNCLQISEFLNDKNIPEISKKSGIPKYAIRMMSKNRDLPTLTNLIKINKYIAQNSFNSNIN